jgi:hypothetical protein
MTLRARMALTASPSSGGHDPADRQGQWFASWAVLATFFGEGATFPTATRDE